MQKRSRQRFRFAIFVLAGASLLLLAAFRFQTKREHSHVVESLSSSKSRISSLPATVPWARERPEELDYIDPQKLGVAFLAKTIYLRADRVVSRPHPNLLICDQANGFLPKEPLFSGFRTFSDKTVECNKPRKVESVK